MTELECDVFRLQIQSNKRQRGNILKGQFTPKSQLPVLPLPRLVLLLFFSGLVELDDLVTNRRPQSFAPLSHCKDESTLRPRVFKKPQTS